MQTQRNRLWLYVGIVAIAVSVGLGEAWARPAKGAKSRRVGKSKVRSVQRSQGPRRASVRRHTTVRRTPRRISSTTRRAKTRTRRNVVRRAAPHTVGRSPGRAFNGTRSRKVNRSRIPGRTYSPRRAASPRANRHTPSAITAPSRAVRTGPVRPSIRSGVNAPVVRRFPITRQPRSFSATVMPRKGRVPNRTHLTPSRQSISGHDGSASGTHHESRGHGARTDFARRLLLFGAGFHLGQKTSYPKFHNRHYGFYHHGLHQTLYDYSYYPGYWDYYYYPRYSYRTIRTYGPLGGGYYDSAFYDDVANDVIGQGPVSDADLFLQQGSAAFVEGRYEEARGWYLRAVLVDEADGFAKLLYGIASFATGEYETAAFAVRRAFIALPELITEPPDVGSLYRDHGVFDEQIKGVVEFLNDRNRRGVAADSGDVPLLLAYLYFAVGEPDLALAVVDGFSKAHPGDELASALREEVVGVLSAGSPIP